MKDYSANILSQGRFPEKRQTTGSNHGRYLLVLVFGFVGASVSAQDVATLLGVAAGLLKAPSGVSASIQENFKTSSSTDEWDRFVNFGFRYSNIEISRGDRVVVQRIGVSSLDVVRAARIRLLSPDRQYSARELSGLLSDSAHYSEYKDRSRILRTLSKYHDSARLKIDYNKNRVLVLEGQDTIDAITTDLRNFIRRVRSSMTVREAIDESQSFETQSDSSMKLYEYLKDDDLLFSVVNDTLAIYRYVKSERSVTWGYTLGYGALVKSSFQLSESDSLTGSAFVSGPTLNVVVSLPLYGFLSGSCVSSRLALGTTFIVFLTKDVVVKGEEGFTRTLTTGGSIGGDIFVGYSISPMALRGLSVFFDAVLGVYPIRGVSAGAPAEGATAEQIQDLNRLNQVVGSNMFARATLGMRFGLSLSF